jgi:hypothetical protein
MYRRSLASCKKFVIEDFEPILFTEPARDIDVFCEMNWYAIKKLWTNESCNIFWLGADTLIIKPTSLFSDRFKEFRMFNYTDPKQTSKFDHYLNDDSRYYPATMSEDIWQIGQNLWKYRDDDPEKLWGFDQNRHNTMFWSQDIPFSDVFHPNLNFMCGPLRSLDEAEIIRHLETWNNCKFQDVNILHLQGTWGSSQRITLMDEFCKNLGISV